MQDLIKRYFWVLGGAVVMVCSVFAAKATSHILEAKFLGDSDHAPRVDPGDAGAVAVKQTRSKDGARLITRDIFCSECTPAVAAASTNPNDIQNTTLPLVLLATNVAPKADDSLRDDRQHRESAAGQLRRRRSDSGRERQAQGDSLQVRRLRERRPHRAARARRSGRAGGGTGRGGHARGRRRRAAGRGRQRHQEDRRHHLRDRQESRREDPREPDGRREGRARRAGGAERQAHGFKLYAIRPSSVYAKIGLTNGDTLSAINGLELTTADKALEVYTKLREATSPRGRDQAPRQADDAQVHDPVIPDEIHSPHCPVVARLVGERARTTRGRR